MSQYQPHQLRGIPIKRRTEAPDHGPALLSPAVLTGDEFKLGCARGGHFACLFLPGSSCKKPSRTAKRNPTRAVSTSGAALFSTAQHKRGASGERRTADQPTLAGTSDEGSDSARPARLACRCPQDRELIERERRRLSRQNLVAPHVRDCEASVSAGRTVLGRGSAAINRPSADLFFGDFFGARRRRTPRAGSSRRAASERSR